MPARDLCPVKMMQLAGSARGGGWEVGLGNAVTHYALVRSDICAISVPAPLASGLPNCSYGKIKPRVFVR